MVHAGVILLIRIEPLLLQVPDMMIALAFAGLATTALAGSAVACRATSNRRWSMRR